MKVSITMKQFENAVKSVLLKKADGRATYENCKPSKEELNKKWRLDEKNQK